MDIGRRTFLASAATLAVLLNHADAENGSEVIALWPSNPPDGAGPQDRERMTAKGSVTNVSRPRLIMHRPVAPNGTAVLVISGGGYAHIELGKESTPTAIWLLSLGVTAFELVYRLPQEVWTPAAPFQDAQRAMRLIRDRSGSLGLDPARIGVIGFSAGGHLAGMTAAKPTHALYSPVDSSDAISARPDFAALIYPVLTMLPPFDKTHARREILGANASDAQAIAYSVERQVDQQTPRTFLAQALDDPISPIDNSLLMLSALRQANVSSELHVFQSGGHGWGLGSPNSPVHAWPALFTTWAALNGFLK